MAEIGTDEMQLGTNSVGGLVVVLSLLLGDGAGDPMWILSIFIHVLNALPVGIFIWVIWRALSRLRAEKKRDSELWEVSRKLGLRFSPNQSWFLSRLFSLPAFRPGRRMSIQNLFRGERQGVEFAIFDYITTVQNSHVSSRQSVMYFRAATLDLPGFWVTPKADLPKGILKFVVRTLPVIDLPAHLQFSQRYVVGGDDEKAV